MEYLVGTEGQSSATGETTQQQKIVLTAQQQVTMAVTAAAAAANGGNAQQPGGEQPQQPQQAPIAPAPASTDVAFDMSSYDPLQAQAFQLTASAGLANVAAPTTQDAQQQQQQQFFFVPQQQQQVLAAVGAYAQPATAALQSIAPATAAPSQMEATTTTAVNATAAQQQPQQYYVAAPAMTPSFTPQTFPPAAPAAQALAASAAAMPAFATTATTPSKRPSPDTTGGSNKKQQYLASVPPSVVSASTSATDFDDKKLPSNWSTMSADDKRRWERNMREQQRSHKISQQIKELRAVLAESHVPFKPNKYSILLSVAEYIKQLQSRAIMLDAEHRKLVDTVRQTSELVNSGKTPPADDVPSTQEKVGNDADMLFVQGLEYRPIFEQSSAAMGVAALDGRILACNAEFETVLGYSREELLRQSLFSVMQNHEEVFLAMGNMLKADDVTLDNDNEEKPPLYWSGVVGQKDNQQLYMNITLTRSSDGMPKFFNCALMLNAT